MKKFGHIIVLLFVVMAFLGCKTKREIIEVPVVKTEYVYRDSIKYDSVFYRDSIYVEKNDSIVYVNKVQYKYRYKYLTKTDSFIRRDTIYKPVEKIVKVEVERNLTSKEKIYIEIGRTISIGLSIFIIALLITYYLKRKK